MRNHTNNARNDRHSDTNAGQYGRRATDHLAAFITSSFAAQVIGQFPQEGGEAVNEIASHPKSSYMRNAHTTRHENITHIKNIQDTSA